MSAQGGRVAFLVRRGPLEEHNCKQSRMKIVIPGEVSSCEIVMNAIVRAEFKVMYLR